MKIWTIDKDPIDHSVWQNELQESYYSNHKELYQASKSNEQRFFWRQEPRRLQQSMQNCTEKTRKWPIFDGYDLIGVTTLDYII